VERSVKKKSSELFGSYDARSLSLGLHRLRCKQRTFLREATTQTVGELSLGGDCRVVYWCDEERIFFSGGYLGDRG